MSDLSLPAGDTAPVLVGTITNADGTAYDLTGCTVRFQMRLSTDFRFTVDASAAITSATGGLVQYTWMSGDLATPGDYVSRWQIYRTSDGTVEHTTPSNSIVVESL